MGWLLCLWTSQRFYVAAAPWCVLLWLPSPSGPTCTGWVVTDPRGLLAAGLGDGMRPFKPASPAGAFLTRPWFPLWVFGCFLTEGLAGLGPVTEGAHPGSTSLYPRGNQAATEKQGRAWQSKALAPYSRGSSLLCLLQRWPGLGEEDGCVLHCCWKWGRAGGPLRRVLVAPGPRFSPGLFDRGKMCGRHIAAALCAGVHRPSPQ